MISGGSSVYRRHRASHKNPQPVEFRPLLPTSPCCTVVDRDLRDRSCAGRARRP
jgi:hypothetical protein